MQLESSQSYERRARQADISKGSKANLESFSVTSGVIHVASVAIS